MKMWNGLSAVRTVVDHDPVAFGEVQLFRGCGGDKEKVAEQGLIGRGRFGEARNVFFRYDQQMHRCLRLNVVKDHTEIVLVLDLGGDFAIDDFLKNGFRHEKNCLNRR